MKRGGDVILRRLKFLSLLRVGRFNASDRRDGSVVVSCERFRSVFSSSSTSHY